MTLADAIRRLERMQGTDGRLVLDRQQADALLWLLWALADGDPVVYALKDLLGTLSEEKEVSA